MKKNHKKKDKVKAEEKEWRKRTRRKITRFKQK